MLIFCQAVPVKKKKLLAVVSYTSSPLAGMTIAFRLAVDIRGNSIPFVMLLTSSMEDACGDELSVVMLTWAVDTD